MTIRQFIGLAAVGLMATACQPDSFRLNGIVHGINDGDTLFLTRDFRSGTPQDTLVVSNGKFAIHSRTDSTSICMIYQKDHPETNAIFFVEPEEITVELSTEYGKSRVSGSKVNNEFQAMSDNVLSYSTQINKLTEQAYQEGLTPEQQVTLIAETERLYSEMMLTIVTTAERNIDNELGFFIVTNYQDEDHFPLEKRQELIAKMPAAMQLRAREELK